MTHSNSYRGDMYFALWSDRKTELLFISHKHSQSGGDTNSN